ncbi:HAD family hydrolase [Lactiplantibacillus garii]|uniref:HAD family hydrolase n=1 Tax=Lactiplantibacillus garii TaxID=2306423 RepID=A0A3R8J904_9LACO|nr:HAD family hydrolase [Lactiplantibacillus garii]RRK11364.1 HAD family hydrolase [Lactiplantibacillus garii]
MADKYLTFDCYGTLINTDPVYQWIENLARAAGLDPQTVRDAYDTYEEDPVSVQPYLDYADLVRENLKHLDGMFDQEHFFEAHYVECLQVQRNLLPYPDVVATLRDWHDQGIKLIMMSNSSWDIMPANVAALQVPFDAVVTAEDVQAYKPDLKFFKHVQDRFHLTTENHWHVARGYASDVVPAAQMGWPMVWVNRGNAEPSGREKPTHVVADLAAVKAWVG